MKKLCCRPEWFASHRHHVDKPGICIKIPWEKNKCYHGKKVKKSKKKTNPSKWLKEPSFQGPAFAFEDLETFIPNIASIYLFWMSNLGFTT